MSILRVAAMAALLFAATPAAAQEAPAPPPLSAAIKEDHGFTTRKALALRYLEAAGIHRVMMISLRSMVRAIPVDPGVPEANRDEMRAIATDAMEAVLPEYFDHIAGLYAEALSQDELLGLVEFYESDLGKSIVLKSEVLGSRTEEMMRWLMPRYQAEMKRMICDRLGCADRPAPRVS